jgi:hypothetical protein
MKASRHLAVPTCLWVLNRLQRSPVVVREVAPRLRPPKVEALVDILGKTVPILVNRHVIDVAGILAVASPRIAHIMEVVRSEDTAAAPHPR